MSQYPRDDLNVRGIPMSRELGNMFRVAEAVDSFGVCDNFARFKICWDRNVLTRSRYLFLVGAVRENLELYRGILTFYLSRESSTVHSRVLARIARLDPGARVESYFLYARELALSYPCAVRGAALRSFIEEDLQKFSLCFPRSTPEEMLRMIRGSTWLSLRL